MIEPLPERLERALNETLMPNERVFMKLKGTYKEALICTSSRVIILKGGLMTGQVFGTDTFQAPYANIAGVQVKLHLFTGYFELSAGGMQNTEKSFWSRDDKFDPAKAPNCISLTRDRAKKFRAACAFIMERQANGSVPSLTRGSNDAIGSLERLASLRQSGVLSETEFRAMKAQILAKR
jgi:hypothetical protein